MIEVTIEAIAGKKIAVTNTATTLNALMATAASTTITFPRGLDTVEIMAEDGDIRACVDGLTPTATQGDLISAGEKKTYSGIAPSKMRLIRTGASNVACSVRVGFREPSL